ncbi:cupin domain-containing protein [Oscillatoria sp. FACHB-1406]|uniref:1,2-dihydroxy-3-keto-5-methylthiopentene dioxygenase n=1 Tax=Oscillatoria sp. FACHB-1406 TaxID=2692846 RepID=UPI001687D852|nr:cupin domain-containing protein [Oscillatoria sp. FACHB-1406]MBD2579257.1 acireductone dioxygenase [Oscillatoria sp. FACHB-1406]
MAILQLEDGTTYTQTDDIARELAALNVNLARWPVGDNETLQTLLAKAALDEAEKEEVLQSIDRYFEQLKQEAGYQTRDLIVLHPDIPNLDALLAKFQRCHTHGDDEVRYIIEGEGVFGFVTPEGKQMELTIQPEEFINVPAGTEHWFYLTPQKRIKAVRYFTSMEGWVPEYTETAIRMRPLALT